MTLEELGGEVQSFYLTMGPHDTVAIVTLPDDATLRRWRSRWAPSATSAR